MKKLLSLILCLSMLFALLPLSAVDAYAAREAWSEAFYSFALGNKYTISGQIYGTYASIRFGLHDLDGDGVPELIAFNGGPSGMAGMTNYVYAYRNGKVTYLGDAGFRIGEFVYASGSGYPGLYFQSGNSGYYPGYYYTVQNGRLKEELVLETRERFQDDYITLYDTQKTSDNTLYGLFSGLFTENYDDWLSKRGRAEMSMLTIAELRIKGWDNFVAQSMASDNTLFTDVNIADYFFKPVKWAVDKNITNGTGNKAFSPDDNCSTAQILTFLYRSQGEPRTNISNPFNDVKSSDYFYNAALWAYEKGLVNGTSFGGNVPCTRAAAVTYLWALARKPASSSTKFNDVPAGADYAQAVAWAVNRGITSGTSSTTFSPNDICTRGQIVTFLYRAYA